MPWLDKTTRRITRTLCFFRGLMLGGAVGAVCGIIIFAVCFLSEVQLSDNRIIVGVVASAVVGLFVGIYAYRFYLNEVKKGYKKREP